MDLGDFRRILDSSGVDVWAFIDAAILVASLDHGSELRLKRDKIVEALYCCCSCNRLKNHVSEGHENENCVDKGTGFEIKGRSPPTPECVHNDDDVADEYGGLFEDEEKRILDIRYQLDDPNQSVESLLDLLRTLDSIDITVKELQETDIGRHVNNLRKKTLSSEVKVLARQLVSKWRNTVDEWVKSNPNGDSDASDHIAAKRDSNGVQAVHNNHHQIQSSPAPTVNNAGGNTNSNRKNTESENRPPQTVQQKTSSSPSAQQSTPRKDNTPQKSTQYESNFDPQKLASARKRLQENYKEAENVKKQRTIQVMDIHQIPKPKNAYFPKNKGCNSQTRH